MASSWREWYAEEYKSMSIVSGCVIVLVEHLGERAEGGRGAAEKALRIINDGVHSQLSRSVSYVPKRWLIWY
jgi:hypothetical protein